MGRKKITVTPKGKGAVKLNGIQDAQALEQAPNNYDAGLQANQAAEMLPASGTPIELNQGSDAPEVAFTAKVETVKNMTASRNGVPVPAVGKVQIVHAVTGKLIAAAVAENRARKLVAGNSNLKIVE